MIRLLIYEGVFHTCPKSLGCHDEVRHCCDGHSTIIPVSAGTCSVNTWSWNVDTSQYGFRPDGEYFISATGRNGAVENTSFFTVSGMPEPDLFHYVMIDPPVKNSGGGCFRFSGAANTVYGPRENLIFRVSSVTGPVMNETIPVIFDGTRYGWNYSANSSAFSPGVRYTVNVTSVHDLSIGNESEFVA